MNGHRFVGTGIRTLAVILVTVAMSWHPRTHGQDSAGPKEPTAAPTPPLGPDGKPLVLPENPPDPARTAGPIDEQALKAVEQILQGGNVPPGDLGLFGDMLEHLHQRGSVLDGSMMAPSHVRPMGVGSRPSSSDASRIARKRDRHVRAAESLLRSARWLERLSPSSQAAASPADLDRDSSRSDDSFDEEALHDHNGADAEALPSLPRLSDAVLVNELRRRAVWHLKRALDGESQPTVSRPNSP